MRWGFNTTTRVKYKVSIICTKLERLLNKSFCDAKDIDIISHHYIGEANQLLIAESFHIPSSYAKSSIARLDIIYMWTVKRAITKRMW